jgi:excinuclease ABC subunit C
MATSDELRKKLDRLPVSPGVYLFRNDQGRIIYIGKAKVLRNRVRSYFMRGNDGRYQYDRLVRAIQDLEVIVTDNELEAMILESSLVRHHVPRYNVTLRDDKSLPYLKVTKELYPRIYLSRRPARDGSRYFGPFTDVQHMKRLLKSLKGILQIRRCNLVITQSSIDRKKHRVCIYYEMGQCAGPCEGLVSPEDYIKNVDMFLDFLKGRTQPLADDLRQQMEDLASDQEFERAAEVRDQLRALEKLTVHQKVISLYAVSRDVIALAREEDDACAVIFRIRDGKLVGRMPFFLKGLGNSTDADILQAFLQQVYVSDDDLPDELHLPDPVPEMELFEQWLTQRRGKKVGVEFPKIGDKAKLLRLARENALLLLGERRLEVHKRQTAPEALVALKESLKLPRLPTRIEAFDV